MLKPIKFFGRSLSSLVEFRQQMTYTFKSLDGLCKLIFGVKELWEMLGMDPYQISFKESMPN